jgi:hypothetical protein
VLIFSTGPPRAGLRSWGGNNQHPAYYCSAHGYPGFALEVTNSLGCDTYFAGKNPAIPQGFPDKEHGPKLRRESALVFVSMDLRGSLVTSAASAAAAAIIAAASASAAGTTACAALLCLETIAAEDRTIAPGLERNRSLLAAARTNYRCSCCGTRAITTTAPAAVSASPAAITAATTAGLVGLLGLSARLAALRRRISPFLEERLVSSSKCKFPSAVATGKLQISSHGISPFSVCENP